jgi:Fe-S-cluster containining protein
LTGREIARIIFDREKRRILDVTPLGEDLRFKCKRCAVFCCRLGGPLVVEADLKRMAGIGLDPGEFLLPLNRSYGQLKDAVGVLGRKRDGSCVFLGYDISKGVYECGIYEARPAVCRLYPFEFIPEGEESGVLRFIPCCNGLNAGDGKLVNREFIEEHLLGAICDLL